MEELFFLATDEPCTEDCCAENLAETRALRDAGKFVLAVDYASQARQRPHRLRPVPRRTFAGYVTVRELDRITRRALTHRQQEYAAHAHDDRRRRAWATSG